jgi:phosphate starvation-inducible PhoH-like protein
MTVKRKTKPKVATYKNESYKVLDIILKDIKFKAKTENQRKYYNLIEEKEIIICSGPAGVGKSMVSIIKALELLRDPKNNFNQIMVVKPIVEADENLGFLKGSLAEKIEPHLYSSIYLFEKIIGENAVKTLIDEGFLKLTAMAFFRGINIDNTILIAEEFQNATPKQGKTLLTRIGYNSKFIISGDLEQSDRFKSIKETGLYDIMNKCEGIDEIGLFTFEEADIVRNPIISKILNKYK